VKSCLGSLKQQPQLEGRLPAGFLPWRERRIAGLSAPVLQPSSSPHTGSVVVEAGGQARDKATVRLGQGDTRIVTGGDLHWVRDMLRSGPQLAT